MTACWVGLTVVLFLGSVAVHEAAHALVLRRLGYPIVAAGLGVPFPPMLSVRVGRGTIEWTVSPWLLCAYVRPSPDDAPRLAELPYLDATWFQGAGIIANLITAGALALVIETVQGARGQLLLGTTAATALVWLARRPLCGYVFPALGLPTLALTVHNLITALAGHHAAGILGTVQLFSLANSLTSALMLAWSLNLSLAALNLVPLYPLDGGRIADSACQALWGSSAAARYRPLTGTTTALVLLGAWGSDLLSALTR